MIQWDNHFNNVDGAPGFSIDNLSEQDLSIFASVIEEHYKKVLRGCGGLGAESIDRPMREYHIFSDQIDHGAVWCKSNRILSLESYKRLMSTDFFKSLRSHVGEIYISDEENIGRPEIYFRLCRPGPYIDVGPLHADKWFWDLGHGETPEGFRRVKFWFSISSSGKKSGFRMVEGSHRHDYYYKSEERHGFLKPVFDETERDLEIQSFECNPGGFIVFNDALLHGGEILGNDTRVSCEFTLFLKSI